MNFKTVAVTEDDLSPEEYLKLDSAEKANIQSTAIIPPHLGEEGFGKIRVNYLTHLYKVDFNGQ